MTPVPKPSPQPFSDKMFISVAFPNNHKGIYYEFRGWPVTQDIYVAYCKSPEDAAFQVGAMMQPVFIIDYQNITSFCKIHSVEHIIFPGDDRCLRIEFKLLNNLEVAEAMNKHVSDTLEP